MTLGRTFTESEIREGLDVFTSDGELLGRVKTFSGDRFKIDAAMQPDYWLSCDAIASADSTRVTTTFVKDQLGDRKIDDRS
jgi:hypothetical protein